MNSIFGDLSELDLIYSGGIEGSDDDESCWRSIQKTVEVYENPYFVNGKMDCSKDNPGYSLFINSLINLTKQILKMVDSDDFEYGKVVLAVGVYKHLPEEDFNASDTSIPRMVCIGPMSEQTIRAYKILIELRTAIEHEDDDVPFGAEEPEVLDPEDFRKRIKEAQNKLLVLQKKLK